MIAYLARALPLVLRARAGRVPEREGAPLVSRLRMRVQLRQIDVNRHMNQAAYAEVFEWGRLDWMIRSRAWENLRRQGLNPIVAEQHLVYRRELAPCARFEVDTRAVAVDGRLTSFEGHLLVGDRVHAKGTVKLLLVGPDGVASAATVAARMSRYLAPRLEVRDWTVLPS